MTITQDEAKQLIKKVQDGKASIYDERKILAEIESRYRPHADINYLYDQDELKSEFIYASWNAIYRAKLDVGDPIAFCINRGRGAMLDYYRKVSSEKLVLICEDCGYEMTYDRRNTECKVCHSKQLSGVEKESIVPVSSFDNVMSSNITPEDEFIKHEEIDEIFIRLIEYIKYAELQIYEKEMAVEALKTRQDFYDHARKTGKSHSWSITFGKKIKKIFENFEFAV